MISVLFVCLGNICRSPAGEGMLRSFALKMPLALGLKVQSCGIGDWHVGQLPDERMREASLLRGINLTSRAQQFRPEFLDEFNFILAVDKEVLNDLYAYAKTPEQKSKIHLVTEFSKSYLNKEIPDPYYTGNHGFELVLDMLEDSCEGFLDYLQKNEKRSG